MYFISPRFLVFPGKNISIFQHTHMNTFFGHYNCEKWYQNFYKHSSPIVIWLNKKGVNCSWKNIAKKIVLSVLNTLMVAMIVTAKWKLLWHQKTSCCLIKGSIPASQKYKGDRKYHPCEGRNPVMSIHELPLHISGCPITREWKIKMVFSVWNKQKESMYNNQNNQILY